MSHARPSVRRLRKQLRAGVPASLELALAAHHEDHCPGVEIPTAHKADRMRLKILGRPELALEFILSYSQMRPAEARMKLPRERTAETPNYLTRTTTEQSPHDGAPFTMYWAANGFGSPDPHDPLLGPRRPRAGYPRPRPVPLALATRRARGRARDRRRGHRRTAATRAGPDDEPPPAIDPASTEATP